ncbi:MAG: YigZ family protein [Bacteroidia bacterium]
MERIPDEYLTIASPAEGYYREKGSKFLAFIQPTEDEESVKEQLDEIKNAHFKSKHVCYASRLGAGGERERAADAGEPANTAGQPILRQLQKHNLTQVLAVVVRYFGGTKLGKGGLINAYRTATEDALSHTTFVSRYVTERIKLSFSYPELDRVMKLLDDAEGEVVGQNFGIDCQMEINIRKGNISLLNNFLENHPEISVLQ